MKREKTSACARSLANSCLAQLKAKATSRLAGEHVSDRMHEEDGDNDGDGGMSVIYL